MTDESPTDTARLPHPPEAILDLLRRAEASLDDVDAMRAEIRAVRQALESAEEPDVATVASALALSGEGTLTLVGEPLIPSGSGSGTFTWTGTGTGHAPPLEASAWLERVKKYGPSGARVVEFLLRVYSTFH